MTGGEGVDLVDLGEGLWQTLKELPKVNGQAEEESGKNSEEEQWGFPQEVGAEAGECDIERA